MHRLNQGSANRDKASVGRHSYSRWEQFCSFQVAQLITVLLSLHSKRLKCGLVLFIATMNQWHNLCSFKDTRMCTFAIHKQHTFVHASTLTVMHVKIVSLSLVSLTPVIPQISTCWHILYDQWQERTVSLVLWICSEVSFSSHKNFRELLY